MSVWFINSQKERIGNMSINVPEKHEEFAAYWESGYEEGDAAAQWCDMPTIGQRIDRSIDWVGYGDTVTSDNIRDYHATLAHAAEDNSRQYSPFEFTAQEINDLGEWESEEAWAAYEDGIAAGIAANLEERYAPVTIVKAQVNDTYHMVSLPYQSLSDAIATAETAQALWQETRPYQSVIYSVWLFFADGHRFPVPIDLVKEQIEINGYIDGTGSEVR